MALNAKIKLEITRVRLQRKYDEVERKKIEEKRLEKEALEVEDTNNVETWII